MPLNLTALGSELFFEQLIQSSGRMPRGQVGHAAVRRGMERFPVTRSGKTPAVRASASELGGRQLPKKEL
jgi:hypothetical protein